MRPLLVIVLAALLSSCSGTNERWAAAYHLFISLHDDCDVTTFQSARKDEGADVTFTATCKKATK